ncbi:hypothetical protein AQUCO_00600113v1 [Aquilegia coerulea]|uniref:Piwi domain-containing protein n=1 Tax=Aquilegia coerulea TaxID=218851 RepID=A0A2G5EN19_AQUCA|nr:hypothetical protein AQUCO_00600113v1 [Aquilegia coerulea]
MEKVGFEETGGALPPPLPLLQPHGRPERLTEPPKRVAMSRTGTGRSGRRINLVANHFEVSVNVPDAVFFQYSVLIKSEDNQEVEGKGIGRKVMDKLYQTYSSELAGKNFIYDGEKALYTVGSLPQKKFEFTVVLEEAAVKRFTFNVEISFAARNPMKPIALALKGLEADNTGGALRVIDIIPRQQAAKRCINCFRFGCLLVRQSFFHDDVGNFVSVGGGVTACCGFHSSIRTTQGGLPVNMDVSTTPVPVLEFILTNQNLRDPRQIDWGKATKMLKNLRVKATHNNLEFKIFGISEKACNQQYFPLKMRSRDGTTEETVEITVYEYFKNRNIELANSAYLPCLDVGKLKRPNYLPLELCSLTSLQRYTKALSSMQRASLAVKNYRYDDDPILKASGISIEKLLTSFEGRVLNAPTLKVGNSEDCVRRNGRWNFNQKRLLYPIQIKRWAIVNFSARCDISYLSQELIRCGRSKGIHIANPHSLIEEDSRWRRAGPVQSSLPPPEFLLCIFPEQKTCDIYGPWKKKNLHEMGIFTQCLSPTKINDQYLTNVLLKINSKLGEINSLLEVERIPTLPRLKKTPTMILGMDVSHGSPGHPCVVGSRSWTLISKYKASVRTQSPKVEMIDSVELLVEFYKSSQGRKLVQIIFFRDGASESQFPQVLNIELEQIIKAVEHLVYTRIPNITLIVPQKNHHTKLFQLNDPKNVPPGTVVDTQIVHPRNYDFYMCAQNGANCFYLENGSVGPLILPAPSSCLRLKLPVFKKKLPRVRLLRHRVNANFLLTKPPGE